MIHLNCDECGTRLRIKVPLLGFNLCRQCRKLKKKNFIDNMIIFNKIQRHSKQYFRIPISFKLTGNFQELVFQSPGPPPIDNNLGIKIPQCCAVCGSDQQLSFIPIVQNVTTGLFRAYSFSDASIRYPFTISLPVCKRCQSESYVHKRNGNMQALVPFMKKERDYNHWELWGKAHFIFEVGYSHFESFPELHWLRIKSDSKKFLKKIKQHNNIGRFFRITKAK